MQKELFMKYFAYYLVIIHLLSGCKHKVMPQNNNSTTKKTLSYLALGDSYTKGESVVWQQNWPNQLATTLNAEGITIAPVDIIAQTGWRTDDLKEAINSRNPEPHDIVSLLIGVNNFYQSKSSESFEPEFEDLLKTAISLAKGNKDKVFVLSIPDYGYTPFGKDDQARISAGLKQFNEVCEKVCKKYQVKYIYITDITQKGFIEPELVASDGLHPSHIAYQQFVSKMLPEIIQLIQK